MNTHRLLPTLMSTALAATLVVGMSGCSLLIRDPEAAPAPATSFVPVDPGAEAGPEEEVEGDIDSYDLPELTGYTGSGDVEDCADRDIVVDTIGALVEFAGTCASVTVTTNGAVVILESAATVVVEGVGNEVQVLGTAGSVTAAGNAALVAINEVGALATTGVGNVVAADSAASIDAGGSGNLVQWSDGPSAGTDSGVGNTLIRP